MGSPFFYCFQPTNPFPAFFFDARERQRKKLAKKKPRMGGFRALRSATRAPRPRPRRLLKKAGENF